MRIYLTGGTGYIGRVLARRLREDGHEVRALVRKTSNRTPLEELGIACFEGDITDRYSLREGMSGADWVIHAAAEVSMEGAKERFEAANVQGSENVASLAQKLGVGRFLSVSSIAYFGGSPDDGSAATESHRPMPPPSIYSATKHAGERAIREWAKRGLKVTTVYPSLVYGPPGKKEGANVILRNMLLGRFPAMVGADRKTSWVFIDDVVEGIAKVLERGAVGGGYLLAGEIATLRELFARVHALGGARPPKLALPIGLASAALPLVSALARTRGRRAPFSAEQLRSLARHWAFSDERAQRELDWKPRSLDAGLALTLEYLRSQG
jgi:nucleoside-diphosphate-sugar epimerase